MDSTSNISIKVMKKRIGNDISFIWHIYRKSGEEQVPESFAGKEVEVKLISPLQRPVTIEDVSIATGVVTFTFRGKHQVTLGNYVAVLLENKGENGMVTIDVVDAVTLVPHSYMEEDGDDGDVIEATSVELTSTISAGGGGGLAQQQADWAQTDASAVDYIKNKPDLGLYVPKTDDDGHGNMSIYGQGTITMTLADEQGSINQTGSFLAGGWSVSSPDGKFQTFGNSIYRGTIGFDQDSVVWEKTATQQIPAATAEINGLMPASDKSKLDALPTNEQLTEELGDKADSADLAEVATSGSYSDVTDKPTIPTVPTNVSTFTNDAGYITASDVANKQDKMPIVQVASGTTAINAAVNTYYEVAGEVGALAITLPTPTDASKVSMVVIHLTAGTNPNVVIGAVDNPQPDFAAAYDISAGNEYEINCLYNGDKWVVADMEVL